MGVLTRIKKNSRHCTNWDSREKGVAVLTIQVTQNKSHIIFYDNDNSEKFRLSVLNLNKEIINIQINEYGEPISLKLGEDVVIGQYDAIVMYYKKRGSYGYLVVKDSKYKTKHKRV